MLNFIFSVDATAEDGTIGRLVNHSRQKPNLKSRLIDVDGEPYIVLISTRDIVPNDELLYDYGDRAVQSLNAHPWLKH